ncbi:MAG: hypothetical protein H6686_09520 [Fibrobacteria bacterium]|nr:hypothetical protein [Fibrobacteria bacterium]
MNAFGKTHYILLALAALVAGLGLYLLSTGLETTSALVVAPIVLGFAYLVMIPAAILWPTQEKNDEKTGQAEKA